ncbi:MAG: hypothetical protein CMM32_05685 [Rhodospirillaceae bacterium]|nr:hypothetical protein [Rhodospirillaceae bacterium]
MLSNSRSWLQKVATREFQRYMDMGKMQGDKEVPVILAEKQICIQDAIQFARRTSQKVHHLKGRE